MPPTFGAGVMGRAKLAAPWTSKTHAPQNPASEAVGAVRLQIDIPLLSIPLGAARRLELQGRRKRCFLFPLIRKLCSDGDGSYLDRVTEALDALGEAKKDFEGIDLIEEVGAKFAVATLGFEYMIDGDGQRVGNCDDGLLAAP
jgi:hypothetical protein